MSKIRFTRCLSKCLNTIVLVATTAAFIWQSQAHAQTETTLSKPIEPKAVKVDPASLRPEKSLPPIATEPEGGPNGGVTGPPPSKFRNRMA